MNYLTKQGFEELKKELNYLRNIKRREIAERLKKAISFGDLSENAAYEEAKDAQSFLEGRIKELEELLSSVEIIEKKNNGKVAMGSKVKIEGQEGLEEYTIVGSAAEADPLKGMISSESPLGKELMGKKIGDKVEVEISQNRMKYKILKIE